MENRKLPNFTCARRTKHCNMDELFNTIYNSSLPAAKKMLEHAATPDIRDSKGYTLLARAVLENSPDKIYQFIKTGCDINFAGENRISPLHQAVALGHLEACKTLVSFGARLDMKTQSGCLLTDAIHQYTDRNSKYQMVKLLLDHCHDNKQPYLDDALHTALLSGEDGELFDLLLESGADTNKPNKDGIVPLCWAIRTDMPVVEKLIKFGANVNACVKVECYSKHRWPPLTIACQHLTDLNCARLLLSNGANPDLGQISRVKYRCFFPICIAASEGDLQLTKLLLFYNAQVNWGADGHLPANPNMYHRSPLKFALVSGHYRVAKLLLLAGCQVDNCTKTKALLQSALRNPSDFTDWYTEYSRNTPSLIFLCCRFLRGLFQIGIHQKMTALQIPKLIQNQILFTDTLAKT